MRASPIPVVLWVADDLAIEPSVNWIERLPVAEKLADRFGTVMRKPAIANQHADPARIEIALMLAADPVHDRSDAYRFAVATPALSTNRRARRDASIDVGEIVRLDLAIRQASPLGKRRQPAAPPARRSGCRPSATSVAARAPDAKLIDLILRLTLDARDLVSGTPLGEDELIDLELQHEFPAPLLLEDHLDEHEAADG